jgi:hypothetical protein
VCEAAESTETIISISWSISARSRETVESVIMSLLQGRDSMRGNQRGNRQRECRLSADVESKFDGKENMTHRGCTFEGIFIRG